MTTKLRSFLVIAAITAFANVSSAVIVALGGPGNFHGFFSSPPVSSTISFVPDNPSSPLPSVVRGQPGVFNVLPGHIYTIIQSIDGMDTPVTRFQVNADNSYTYLPL